MQTIDTLIIGGGPGGLACATRLAQQGKEVLILERNREIGPKVCAGGITWAGLTRRAPSCLIERAFPDQKIFSSWQKTIIHEDKPIICTIDRKSLGQWMLEQALAAGVHIETGIQVLQIDRETAYTRKAQYHFRNLVGADGSSSLVRRSLGLTSTRIGVGLHAFVPGSFDHMEWHMSPELFHTGYAWIFPHRHGASIGAYACRNHLPPTILKNNFFLWAQKHGIDVQKYQLRAALINFDYQGHGFGNIFLVGDAAGLASGLTGEGIYPAIVSGEAVAEEIIKSNSNDQQLGRMIDKHRLHCRILDLAGRGQTVSKIIMECLVLALRTGFIHFNTLEMGDSHPE